jgi:hypothetical protein
LHLAAKSYCLVVLVCRRKEMATVPGDLIWQIVRKNNSFMVKQFGNSHSKVQFTKEPNNLYNIHSYKYSGQWLLHCF